MKNSQIRLGGTGGITSNSARKFLIGTSVLNGLKNRMKFRLNMSEPRVKVNCENSLNQAGSAEESRLSLEAFVKTRFSQAHFFAFSERNKVPVN